MATPVWLGSSWLGSWLSSWGVSWGTTSTEAFGNDLLHAPSEILRQAMTDAAIATEGTDDEDWPVYATSEPEGPDDCVTVYDTQGRDDGRTMPDGVSHQHHGIQIRVRSRDHQTGYRRGMAIRRWVQRVYDRQVTLDGATYVIECLTNVPDLINVGQDVPNGKRRVFTLNPMMVVTRLS